MRTTQVWRFPYLAYKNGGGGFLIPYFAALALVGIGAETKLRGAFTMHLCTACVVLEHPLVIPAKLESGAVGSAQVGVPVFLLELALGQRFQKGATLALAKLNPRFRGVGLAGTGMAFATLAYEASSGILLGRGVAL